MPTYQVPREQWPAFCSEFYGRHQGWLVTIEVGGGAAGSRVVARDLPLTGMAADLAGDGSIAITAGQGDQVYHRILAPSELRLEQTQAGADLGLLIIAGDGTVTEMRFRSPVLPETVDGI